MSQNTKPNQLFSLSRLLKNVFQPKPGQKIALLIDLENPKEIEDLWFLANHKITIQRHAIEKFFNQLHSGVMEELGLEGGDLYCYKTTGGSNLDLPDKAISLRGQEVSLEADVYPNYDIILCISEYSATAPLTAFAKQYGFKGATLHGLNDTILNSGLSVDYTEVSKEAEKLRLGMTKADSIDIDFVVFDETYTLTLELGQQEAQKSHGLCWGDEPDIANLPAGEIYYVPTSANGTFPLKLENGTIGLMQVKDGFICGGELLRGDQFSLDLELKKFLSDPASGQIGELGFGTQDLPVSGRDIQDEKIIGTVHVATGRSDHLGGDITPDMFKEGQNATHEDILFSPTKTPEFNIPEVRMHKDGTTKVLISNFKPVYMKELLTAELPSG
jgi:hypothetical protein